MIRRAVDGGVVCFPWQGGGLAVEELFDLVDRAGVGKGESALEKDVWSNAGEFVEEGNGVEVIERAANGSLSADFECRLLRELMDR